MIPYERTEWYGFSYLCRTAGSQLPKCLPWVLVAGAEGALFASSLTQHAIGWPIRDLLGQPYAMQVLGLVFGYLSITRLNLCYSRYWEGCSHVKIMHSKWMCAHVQLLSFDRVSTPGVSVKTDPFCVHLTRLFQQLSALSVMKLHVDDWDQFFAEADPAGSAKGPTARRGHKAVEEEAHEKENSKELQKLLTSAEAAFYKRAPDVPVAVISRIMRAITTRQLAGGRHPF